MLFPISGNHKSSPTPLIFRSVCELKKMQKLAEEEEMPVQEIELFVQTG